MSKAEVFMFLLLLFFSSLRLIKVSVRIDGECLSYRLEKKANERTNEQAKSITSMRRVNAQCLDILPTTVVTGQIFDILGGVFLSVFLFDCQFQVDFVCILMK